MRRHIRAANHGIALAELMVCIGIMATIFSLTAVCFAQVIRLRWAHEQYNDRLLSAKHLLRQFAADVRRGTAFLKARGAYAAGEETLIVSCNGGAVIYHVSDGGVERIDATAPQPRKDFVLQAPKLHARFDFDGRDCSTTRSVILTIAWTEPPKLGISRPILSLRAALRSHS